MDGLCPQSSFAFEPPSHPKITLGPPGTTFLRARGNRLYSAFYACPGFESGPVAGAGLSWLAHWGLLFVGGKRWADVLITKHGSPFKPAGGV
jgi:hypothetical protein